MGAVTPFQDLQQQGCCGERTGIYSPHLLKRCYCTPYGTDFLRSYGTAQQDFDLVGLHELSPTYTQSLLSAIVVCNRPHPL